MTINISNDEKQGESKFQRRFIPIGTGIGYGLALIVGLLGIYGGIRGKDVGLFFLFMLIAIGYFAFPIWMASRARKRGRSGLAVATIIVSLFGLGTIMGIVNLFIPAKLFTGDLDIPCPKCNGMTGSLNQTILNKKTGAPAPDLINTILWGLMAIVLIGGGIAMAILIWSEGDSGFIRWTYGSTIAGFGFLAIGLGIGRFGVLGVMEYINAERVAGTMYKCGQCGHTWNDLQLNEVKIQE